VKKMLVIFFTLLFLGAVGFSAIGCDVDEEPIEEPIEENGDY